MPAIFIMKGLADHRLNTPAVKSILSQSLTGRRAMKIKRSWLHPIVNFSIVIVVICIGGIGALFILTDSYIEEELRTRARSYFNSIMITREWNENYNGVYVFKGKGVESNQYVREPDLFTGDGRVLTVRNVSVMTLELSSIAQKKGLFTYNLRSLRPVNSQNTPDDFEMMALASFEHGEKESFLKSYSGNKIEFRHMAPLYVTEYCMRCHGSQGYKPGDVRGGISVTFDITDIEKKLARIRMLIMILAALSLVITAGVFLTSVKHLKRKIDFSRREIERLSVTDELTGIYNRRYFLKKLDEEFERTRRYGQTLSLIITDIDNFKMINERYGFQAGDAVLRAVAQIIKASCRESDIPARYSGEEFGIILPATPKDGAAAMAEKLRRKVSSTEINGYDFSVTISLGISVLTPEDAYSPSTMIYNADAALFRAKEDGMNRFVIT